jgi:hypothetical protein
LTDGSWAASTLRFLAFSQQHHGGPMFGIYSDWTAPDSRLLAS